MAYASGPEEYFDYFYGGPYAVRLRSKQTHRVFGVESNLCRQVENQISRLSSFDSKRNAEKTSPVLFATQQSSVQNVKDVPLQMPNLGQ